MKISSGLVGYIAIGFLYQYLKYGDAPLNLISTWVHVLFWWLLILFAIAYYLFWLGLICAIIGGLWFLWLRA